MHTAKTLWLAVLGLALLIVTMAHAQPRSGLIILEHYPRELNIMSVPQETPLNKVTEWPQELVQRLQQSWITTVEQVVAASATPGGLRSLAEQLEVPEEEVVRLVRAARAHLDPAVAAQLEQPVNTRTYGLGVLRPRSEEPKP